MRGVTYSCHFGQVQGEEASAGQLERPVAVGEENAHRATELAAAPVPGAVEERLAVPGALLLQNLAEVARLDDLHQAHEQVEEEENVVFELGNLRRGESIIEFREESVAPTENTVYMTLQNWNVI